jgi:hypothetical protein
MRTEIREGDDWSETWWRIWGMRNVGQQWWIIHAVILKLCYCNDSTIGWLINDLEVLFHSSHSEVTPQHPLAAKGPASGGVCCCYCIVYSFVLCVVFLSLLFSNLMHECYVIINSLMLLSEILVAILHYIIKSFPELIAWYQYESGISVTELLYWTLPSWDLFEVMIIGIRK